MELIEPIALIELRDYYNPAKKILEKLRKLRKTYNHERNINGIYNEKVHCNCPQSYR